MVTVSPCLWMDEYIEEAVRFYTSLFHNSRVTRKTYYNGVGESIHGRKTGELMTIEFILENQRFIALNGGDFFKMNPLVSMLVNFENERNLNNIWKQLINEGKILIPLGPNDDSQLYGWVQDKYGMSWQLNLSKKPKVEQKIIPSLLFNNDRYGKAEEAMNFYSSIFKSKVIEATRYTDDDVGETGKLKSGTFKLNGYQLKTIDSRAHHGFDFNESISLIIECDNQKEIDHFWNGLTTGSDPSSQICGWLKDKYGVFWQVMPRIIFDLESNHLSKSAKNVTEAIFRMKKIILADIIDASKRS